jgi:hypothetical protein
MGHKFAVPSLCECKGYIFNGLYFKHTKRNTHIRTDKRLTTTVSIEKSTDPTSRQRGRRIMWKTKPKLSEDKFYGQVRKFDHGSQMVA